MRKETKGGRNGEKGKKTGRKGEKLTKSSRECKRGRPAYAGRVRDPEVPYNGEKRRTFFASIWANGNKVRNRSVDDEEEL